MPPLGVVETDLLTVPRFTRSTPGLWDAIVDKIAQRDPAGSTLAGPSWPGQPIVPEPGMFDFVRS